MRERLPSYDPEGYTPYEPDYNLPVAPEPTIPQPEPPPEPPPEPSWAEQRQAAFAYPGVTPTDLAPDFARIVPTAALEEEERRTQADSFLAEQRRAIADKWLELQQTDMRAAVEETIGQTAANVGDLLTQKRTDLLSHVPEEVASGQRALNPLEALELASVTPPLGLPTAAAYGLSRIAALGGEPDPLLETGLGLVIPGGAVGKASKWTQAMQTDDILRAANRAPGPGPGLKSQIQAALGKVEEQMADRFAPINRAGPQTEALMANYAGRTEGGFQRAADELGPAYTEIGDDLEQLNKYRLLNTYIETATAKMNPERLGVGVSSIPDAQKALTEMQATLDPAVWARVQRTDDLVNRAMTNLLEDEVQAGLVPRELADKLEEMFPHYNPTVHTRFLEELKTGTAGRNLRQMTNTLKRLTEEGSEDDILPPMQAALKTMLDRDLAIRRNQILNSTVEEGGFPAKPSLSFTTGAPVGLKPDSGEMAAWLAQRVGLLEAVPEGQAVGTFRRVGDHWLQAEKSGKADELRGPGGALRGTQRSFTTEEVARRVTDRSLQAVAEGEQLMGRPKPPPAVTVVSKTGRIAPGRVNFMKEGRPWEAEVPEDVARAMSRLGTDQMNTVEQMAMGLNHSLRMGATVVNPAFLATNAIRDYVGAYMREGVLPPEYIEGLRQAITHGPTWRQFMRAGGGYGQSGGYYARGTQTLAERFGDDPEKIAKGLKSVEDDIRRAGGAVLSNEADWTRFTRALEDRNPAEIAKFFATLGPIQEVGTAIETAPKLAAFSRHLARGESEAMATMQGRRANIDLSRAGELTKHLNAFTPFLNARIQGGLNLGRTLRDKPAARVRAAGMSSALIGLYLYNRQFPEFADVPSYIKDGYATVMLPGSTPKANGLGYENMNYVTFPLGDWAGLAVAVEEGMKALDGDSKGPLDALGRVVNATNPLPGEGVTGNFLGALPITVPGRVAFEQTANYDFFRQRPIETESMEGLLPELRYSERTSEVAKRISDALPEQVKLSPVRIDHIIQGMTGGAGRLATQAVSTHLLGQEADRPPVAGGLLSGVYRTYGGEIENRAYADRDAAIAELTNQYRPFIRAIEENTGRGMTNVPRELKGITLSPGDQVLYHRTRLAALEEMWRSENLDAQIQDLSVADRKKVIQYVTSAANEVATAVVVEGMGDPEIERRLLQKLEPDTRRALPLEEYTPVQKALTEMGR